MNRFEDKVAFVTASQCVMCAKLMDQANVSHVFYRERYRLPLGLDVLEQAGIPAVLSSGGDSPGNRLEFARWLVSEQNPLVGRVTVNRAWRSFFGRGLIDTSGDFGTQSDPPSHPHLLDWLAVEFMETGWSMKRPACWPASRKISRFCRAFLPVMSRWWDRPAR